MTIVPDTKDWTWVLDRACAECGYNARSIDRYAIPTMIRSNAAAWLEVLARPDVRRRPSAQVWSPLEYACHVRDVYRIYDDRLNLMLTEVNPLYPNWDQDATAVADRYFEQDPLVVSRDLLEAGDAVARSFASIAEPQWTRGGRRSDGAVFTVDGFARYFLHDLVHHLHDVGG
jgi:hypothetical protein